MDGELLLKEVEAFRRQSLAKAFYAPFDINSKNFMHVPEETREWFNQLGDLLQDSCRLSAQGDHQHAAACFAVLCELIEAMEQGDEIVFADELGSWMIPMEGKIWLAAYMTSLAAVSTPEEFTVRAIPLIRRDSYQSFSGKAFQSGRKAADKAQKTHLDAEIKRHKIRTKSTGD